MRYRTDLAVEALENSGEISGASSSVQRKHGFGVTTVEVTDKRGETALCKPKGKYVTIELESLLRREEDAFRNAADVIADELKSLLALSPDDSVLVAALGNETVTPDAVGPRTARYIMATRHLGRVLPDNSYSLRRVAVVETGVLGTTGIESAEIIASLCRTVRPSRVIAVDALCSQSVSRLCRTVQLTDTGIVPGSGVGNRRAALNSAALGVPVAAIGVPTVVDAASLVSELTGADVQSDGLILTPREIDDRVNDISKLIGYAVNLALHDGLTVSDVDMLVS